MITRCLSCSGSGQVLGGGMITIDCPQCGGTGKPDKLKVVKIDYKKAKLTKSYRHAKQRLIEKDISSDDAEKMLDAELKLL